jgi:hypothetical protein
MEKISWTNREKLSVTEDVGGEGFPAYEGGSRSFRPDIQKPHQMENAAWDI